ncbi:HAD family hydrolase [Streptomyces sp. H39-S7]|uniref:HAD family hydrolase n=1 Tax=Streptomyces sp. H39-S7 TaxID=3004357 RepID=UPI0022AF71E1|nr:HAD-IA family hydrolase [Streptomyces sp. H39-S7]MCZ4122274.1 HAD-IA family hydrolase [Streptomyces sp. H39-S7]
MGQLTRPTALLLDFGGVVVATTRRPTWARDMATELHTALCTAGSRELTIEHIEADLKAGVTADAHWKNAMSRPAAPREMTYLEFWTDFVAADWPDAALAFVAANAQPLCHRLGELKQERVTRDGLAELFDACELFGIRVGIVSNALSGSVHRDYMAANGLDKRVAVQIYSDEVAVRKPNPEMIRIAARALATEPEACWYVGDNYDRDVLCGRRAGVGATVLMEARGTYDRPYVIQAEPDAIVPDPHGLLELLLGTRATAA